MTFDPEFAEATYPHRDLRIAVFASSDDVAMAAARRWLAPLDPDSVTYQQHRMIGRLVVRFGKALGEFPQMPRLIGVRRHIWTRGQVNLRQVAPVLAALERSAAALRVIGAAQWLEKGAGQDAFDVFDIVTRHDRKLDIAATFLDHGWQISEWLAEHVETAGVMHFTAGPSARARVLLPRVLKGISPAFLFSDQPGADQAVTIGGVALFAPTGPQTAQIALASSVKGHALADQWLFDLANLQSTPGLNLANLPDALRNDATLALNWAQAEAGIRIPASDF